MTEINSVWAWVVLGVLAAVVVWEYRLQARRDRQRAEYETVTAVCGHRAVTLRGTVPAQCYACRCDEDARRRLTQAMAANDAVAPRLWTMPRDQWVWWTPPEGSSSTASDRSVTWVVPDKKKGE